MHGTKKSRRRPSRPSICVVLGRGALASACALVSTACPYEAEPAETGDSTTGVVSTTGFTTTSVGTDGDVAGITSGTVTEASSGITTDSGMVTGTGAGGETTSGGGDQTSAASTATVGSEAGETQTTGGSATVGSESQGTTEESSGEVGETQADEGDATSSGDGSETGHETTGAQDSGEGAQTTDEGDGDDTDPSTTGDVDPSTTGDDSGDPSSATAADSLDSGSMSGTTDVTTTSSTSSTSSTTGDPTGGMGDEGDMTTGGDGDLSLLSDDFEDAHSKSDWIRNYVMEAWGFDQLKQFDIDNEAAGYATMVPFSSAWFRDYRGPLAYKLVEGDFMVNTRVLARDRTGTGAPDSSFSLAGLMIRTPREITKASWEPGGENYVFASTGTTTSPGNYELEFKNTVASESFKTTVTGVADDIELRVARVRDTVFVLARPTGGSWSIHHRYARADMPSELQVGMAAYTDWATASQLGDPELDNCEILGDGDGNPGLRARFDYVDFERPEVPGDWATLDLTNPAQLSDSDVLDVLGR